MKNFDNKQEQTLVIVKPDGVQRGLIGEVIKRYEQCGLKLVAIKMLIPTKELTLNQLIDKQMDGVLDNKFENAATQEEENLNKGLTL